MGKRKSSSKPQGPKKAVPLPTTFTCLFCNHEKSVTVKLDKKLGIGYLECKVCGQKFQCAINYLSAAVDVYGEWVDAAGKGNLFALFLVRVPLRQQTIRRLTQTPLDSVAKEKVENETSGGRLGLADSGRYAPGRVGPSSRDIDDDDDGGDRRYAGEGIVDDDEY
ncbi:transcription elongation factor [Sporothrix schenckii 1099-18]|uniref:Transcription elongation factor 1 homolog n=1 Tax=Sporothrix schenckii 1099-18 TaxID=1397361 RepID=A0A0F2LWW8_SPOSC|nr:transcription elongation factor [Sporothrix schenckii 1099-18]KJR80411.1 transcription elongation factor [Sporothrix schenckii 1099-18]